MVLRTIVCLVLALALAAAVEEDGLANAHETIKLMKSQGLGADACQALADSSIKDVSSSKSTTQTLLDKLDTGATCAQRGQKEVTAATQSLSDATNAASKAKSAVDTASAVVPVITIPSTAQLMGMQGSCDFIYGSDAVKNANAALVTAQNTKTQADAAVVSYTTALNAAKDAANAAAKQCRCDAKSTLESQWAIASEPTAAAAQKNSWDQAQNILCALNAKSPCNAPAVPTLVKPTLSVDTQAQACTTCASSNLGGTWANNRAAFSGSIGSDCKGTMKFPDDINHPNPFTLEYDASTGTIYWDGRASGNKWQKDADWSKGIVGKYNQGGQTISIP